MLDLIQFVVNLIISVGLGAAIWENRDEHITDSTEFIIATVLAVAFLGSASNAIRYLSNLI